MTTAPARRMPPALAVMPHAMASDVRLFAAALPASARYHLSDRLRLARRADDGIGRFARHSADRRFPAACAQHARGGRVSPAPDAALALERRCGPRTFLLGRRCAF